MQDTKIQWTDATWNPVRGCSKVSPGCKNCYAEKVAARFCGPGLPYEGLADPKTGLWTGKAKLVMDHLSDPLRWRRPRRIFVNSMSDLFHEDLSDAQIAGIFGIMAAAPQHTFQVLTKRADRMRRWFARDVDHATDCGENAAALMGDSFSSYCYGAGGTWPLPNVWIGVSVEDQVRADERIPELLQVPAAVRFLSCEPLLGSVDLTHLDADRAGHPDFCQLDALTGRHTDMGRPCPDAPARIDWVIVGGESGPGARPFDLAWAHSLVRQCAAAGVACFVKQLGAQPVVPNVAGGEPHPLQLKDKKGGDLSEWPELLRVREFQEPRR